MPSLIRANPVTGMAEIFHPDSNLYVQAAAIMQVAGGLEITLATAQGNSLTTIANSISKLADIVTEVKDLQTKIQTFNQSLSTINATGFASLNQSIAANSNTGLQQTLTAINTKLTSLETIVADYSDEFSLIKDYSGAIGTLTTKSTEIKTAIDKLTGILTPPINMVCQTLDLAIANTQYQIVIPVGTKKIAFGCRGDRGLNDVIGDIRYSMIDAQVSGLLATTANYAVLSASFTEEFEILVETAKTIYFASSTASTKLLFRRWS
jgi:prefoldin subunit 5